MNRSARWLIGLGAGLAALMLALLGLMLAGGHSEGQRQESNLHCFGAFVAGLISVGVVTRRSKRGRAVPHPPPSTTARSRGKGHARVFDVRTETGLFRLRMVWWVADPAHDAAPALLAALGQLLPANVTPEALTQARAALVARFSARGTQVLQLALLPDSGEPQPRKSPGEPRRNHGP